MSDDRNKRIFGIISGQEDRDRREFDDILLRTSNQYRYERRTFKRGIVQQVKRSRPK